MEDDAKEEPTKGKEPKFLAKAGWMKKAHGRLLASYKDRYIHVEKTEAVVYENEDLQNCLERLDLENYDKCHELKSPFTKKQRLVLIRSPKSGNKVHDVKFQAQTAEEKEAWIKALRDGINRAKNKVFDEVKIDESSNLDHVTRTRPKGNRNRRPPTRIHMKEVADMSSDGILRLDLDLENALMPNGTHHTTVDGAETPKDAKVPKPASNASEATEKPSGPSAEEESQTEPEVCPQKKVIKPPMPPIKEAKPCITPEDEPEPDEGLVKKVLKPPMPPSKEAKPCGSSVVEATVDVKAEKISEKSPDAKKKAAPPPTPPNKPSSSSSMSNIAEASQSRPNSQPPIPPSKEKKPSPHPVEPEQEVQDTTDEKTGKDDSKKEVQGTAVKTDEAEQSISKEALPSVRDGQPKSPSAAWQVSEEESGETTNSDTSKSSDNEPLAPAETLRKSPSPPPTCKEEPEKLTKCDTKHIDHKETITDQCSTEREDPTALQQTDLDTSGSSSQAEESQPKSGMPTVVVTLNKPVTDSLSLSPLLSNLHGEKREKVEEKSVDSGQHSDDESEGSASEDMLASSTAALRGSHVGLDVLDTSEDDIQILVDLKQTQAAAKSQVRSEVLLHQQPEPTPPLKPSTKARSSSSGDLLSDTSACGQQVTQQIRPVAGNNGVPGDDVMKLEAEVALEMEKTSGLLSRVSQSQRGSDEESLPEDLLTKAMEKLKKADIVLREVQKLKIAKPENNSSNRKSW